ncbi:hypothetical protein [Xylella fastidiosa]|nr:hypothetical protein [Xylella fastidiosa]
MPDPLVMAFDLLLFHLILPVFDRVSASMRCSWLTQGCCLL